MGKQFCAHLTGAMECRSLCLMCRSTRFFWAVVLLAVSWAGPVAAQDITANPFTTADGLLSDRILAVAQSADGWLWVGTTYGLSQFFGSRFRTEGIPQEIVENHIHALLATDDGALWVGADSGLHRRNADGSWDTHLEEPAGLEVDAIRALHLASDGAVWVGGFDGLARWLGGVWETITIGGLPPAVNTLGEDADGHVWVGALGSTGSSIQILKGHELVEVIKADDGLPTGATLTALLRDSDGEMWAATDAGLVQFIGSAVHRIYTEEDGLANNNVWALIEHPEGGLWAGTAKGLIRLKDGIVTGILTSETTLAGDSVNALAYDLEGNLWLGTSAGVSRLPLGQWMRESHPSLRGTEIRKVLAGADGAGYAVTPAGIFQRTPAGEWTWLNEGLPGQAVYALAHGPDGDIWAGTNAGLAKLVDGRFVTDIRVPKDLCVQAILIDLMGRLWVGSTLGLYQLSGEEVRLFSKRGGALGQDSVLALWETVTGDIWVGTSNGGASRYRDGTWALVDRANTSGGLADDFVLAGLEDSAGNLWFATRAGVSRLQAGADPHDPAAWHTIQIPKLAGEQVYALWEDNARPGNIWAGTDGGLNLIGRDLPPRTFTRDDGLSHKWINALDQAPDGTLWIGTASGLTYHRDARQAPQIELGPLIVDNEVCDAACLAGGVPYRSETAMFQYAASDLGDLAGLEYLVSIQAGELISQVPTSDGSVIQSLEPGMHYRFSVQAFDRDLNHSAVAGPVELFVQSPTRWERLREEPYFPYLLVLVVLGVFGLALTGGIKIYQWKLQRQFFGYALDLEVSLTANAAEPRLQVLVEGSVRKPGKLNQILGSLHFPPALVKAFVRGPEPFKVEATSSPDLDRIRRLEAELREFRAEAPGMLQDLGGLLYDALFPDPIPEELRILGLGLPYHSARLSLRQEQAQHLKAIPWEFMYDPHQPAFLTIDSQVTLVRDLSGEEDNGNLAVEAPLRILVALSNPKGKGLTELKRQEEELSAIEKALASSSERRLVDIVPLRHASWEDFESSVRSGGFDLVHFTGHGGIWAGQNLPVLYFEGEDGTPIRVPQKPLVDLFENASTQDRRPKLVVLNACRSAEQDVIQGTLGLAEALVQLGKLPAAIGMGYEISEDAAVVFCEQFYITLAAHWQVDHAIMVARGALASRLGRGRLHWGGPRLYSRVSEGVILNLISERSETDEPNSR
ncbi:MAG: two-component regulator propeller domain-containing protein [Marinobacter sp.]|uniref:two-component regulator propeller domain-containing protein n=1 Tax=Marinobacter sp. TaxID=50741 RepID=UPI00396EB976